MNRTPDTSERDEPVTLDDIFGELTRIRELLSTLPAGALRERSKLEQRRNELKSLIDATGPDTKRDTDNHTHADTDRQSVNLQELTRLLAAGAAVILVFAILITILY
jgi:hypothetical protein